MKVRPVREREGDGHTEEEQGEQEDESKHAHGDAAHAGQLVWRPTMRRAWAGIRGRGRRACRFPARGRLPKALSADRGAG